MRQRAVLMLLAEIRRLARSPVASVADGIRLTDRIDDLAWEVELLLRGES